MAIEKFLQEYGLTKEQVIFDYILGCESREVSLMGRKEVFMGKAKFGIFGDGKELPQIAMAKYFRKGDFRSGYYRDQTFMFALREYTIKQFFAQLYAHTDVEKEPVSAGRLMTGHFGTKFIHENGEWVDLVNSKNSTTDVSPTAAQMPRLLGLAYASKLFKENKDLHQYTKFSNQGKEIAWGTIGNASTSEGAFFETMNAGGVLQVPMIISVWDDDYGISVPSELQTTKGDISAILEGFRRDNENKGYEIIKVRGWDYEGLIKAYAQAEKVCREEYVPVLIHVNEVTQPQGHSTSGSHERYKPKERLEWEKEYDCLLKMREWIIENNIESAEELDEIEKKAKKQVKAYRDESWKEYRASIDADKNKLLYYLGRVIGETKNKQRFQQIKQGLENNKTPYRADVIKSLKHTVRFLTRDKLSIKKEIIEWHEEEKLKNHIRYGAHLYNETPFSAKKVKAIAPIYSDESPMVDGRQVLQACFDKMLERDARVFAIGEDVGKIGDVNQGFAGLQDKYGESRVTDTGIRECTIIGQAIGAAMRGLRPIAEIQYLDYILYAIQILSDDLATVQYRSFGQQIAPVIVRTRGHRLEGVWHSGSPIGMMLNSLRGTYICTPRNMTQAAGFYNTMLESNDSALIIECLNGYRLKEQLPDNIGEFKVPLGVPDIMREGDDVTVVTYGSMVNVVLDAADQLSEVGISLEVIDVQTLIPFDVNNSIVESLKKTNKVLFADEDVPGGASAYMMQQVLEMQEGYYYLDSTPKSIHSWAHRPAYATDGDYFSKPNSEDVFDYVYDIMHDYDPENYPAIYSNYKVKYKKYP